MWGLSSASRPIQQRVNTFLYFMLSYRIHRVPRESRACFCTINVMLGAPQDSWLGHCCGTYRSSTHASPTEQNLHVPYTPHGPSCSILVAFDIPARSVSPGTRTDAAAPSTHGLGRVKEGQECARFLPEVLLDSIQDLHPCIGDWQ